MAAMTATPTQWRVALMRADESIINHWLSTTEIMLNADGGLHAHFTLGANGQVLVLYNKPIRDQEDPR